ncbi:MAG: glucose-1-phosphate adenylyltransferase [Gemmataceae bacterium]
MSRVLSLILGGGRGTRLYPLTKLRSKPAVPVGGKYRLIDIPISNCIHSELTNIYVLTQFLSTSLHRHIVNTYRFDMFNRGFVELLAAQQAEPEDESRPILEREWLQGGWYEGTADAVRRNMRHLVEDDYTEVLVLSGDQLYRMDFRKLIKRHRLTSADITVAVLPVSRDQVSGFGIVSADDSGRITGFVEKPKTEDQLATFATPREYIEGQGIAYNNRPYLASMGIYLFNRDTLVKLLQHRPLATDFGKDVFPRVIRELQVQTHLFDGYWEDLGTIKSYHDCHMALAGDNSPFMFHHPDGIIYTRMRNLPPSRIVDAKLKHAVVSDGCLIQSGTTVERSIVGVRCRIGRNATIRDTVIIGADRYETDEERRANRVAGRPDLTVGDGSVIERAILDKDCRIGRDVKIVNAARVQEIETANYCIREGIVVVPRGAVVPDGAVI